MSNMTPKPASSLPEELPEGEAIIWQGRPSWRSLALRAFHIRKVGIYFGLILAWRVALGLYERFPLHSIAADAVPLLLLALSSVCILALLAWVYCRTTSYTITNRRVFMRFGAALPMMLNIPFNIVGAAAANVHRDGTADIPLQLSGSGRIAYPQLWPHARPWHLKNPQPMLRSLPNGARVASLLAAALAGSPPPAMEAVTLAPEVNGVDHNAPGELAPAAA